MPNDNMIESNDSILINWENIERYSSVPIKYRFVDKCVVVPGKEAVGTKVVSSQDWYFKIHFPGNPIMPGVFLMEAMQQTGMLIITTMPDSKERLMLFQGCKAMRIFKPVRPGDVIHMYVSLRSYRLGVAVFHGEVKREGEVETLVCSMDFTMVSKDKTVRIQKEYSGGGNIGKEINWYNIDNYLADPIEYRFIDKAQVVPGESAIGFKSASMLDWYFNMRSSVDPIMPECLLLEAQMQTGVLAVTTMSNVREKLMMFYSCSSCVLYDVVRPGDIIQSIVTLMSYRRGVAKYHAESVHMGRGSIMCEADFTLISPGSLVKL